MLRRFDRRLPGLAICVFLTMMQGGLAEAETAGAPYQGSSSPFVLTIPDRSGSGTATADASADATSGQLSASAAATSSAPAGALVIEVPFCGYINGYTAGTACTGLGVGGSYARSYGRIFHTLPVAAGSRTLTINFGSVTSSHRKTPAGQNAYALGAYVGSYAAASVLATVTGNVYPCSSPANCAPSYVSGTRDLGVNPASGGSFSISISFRADSNGRIVVYPALSATAVATGPQADAAAAGSAIVTSIVLT